MLAIKNRIDKTIDAIKLARIKSTICDHFGENCPTATAIFIAESGLNPNAKGWNCHYGEVSKACKPEDRHLAWSVDCGIAQLNFRGQECPAEAFDYQWNIQKAYEWKFKPSGWRPWSVFNSGAYLQYLQKV